MNNKNLYSVFHRLRSKHLEMILPESEICVHDQTDIVFQSFSLDKAHKYFDSIKSVENDYWYSKCKYLIITPLDRSEEDGFINGKTITQYHFN